MPVIVELRAPDFVHTLVLGPAEGHGRAQADIET